MTAGVCNRRTRCSLFSQAYVFRGQLVMMKCLSCLFRLTCLKEWRRRKKHCTAIAALCNEEGGRWFRKTILTELIGIGGPPSFPLSPIPSIYCKSKSHNYNWFLFFSHYSIKAIGQNSIKAIFNYRHHNQKKKMEESPNQK